MTSVFDQTATSFEHYRTLPVGVPEAIRRTIWEFTGVQRSARVLDLGAGSGRIGRAFVEAGDAYIGVDFSLSMIQEFRARNSVACLLQADGGRLPFRDACFELVLLMQVLAGTHNWRTLLCETVRVVAPRGSIVVGHTVTPSTGVDEQMKRQLNVILKETGRTPHESRKSREQSLEWLRAGSSQRTNVTAASWTVLRTPKEFLERHRSAGRFSALPVAVQEQALDKLSGWARQQWGSLDKVFSEKHSFELHVFKFSS